MSDLISRAAAIDALVDENIIEHMDSVYDSELHRYKRAIQRILSQLPSAELEIVHCKNCRWGREVCGNIECFADINVPPEYHGYEWFCPNGERI